MQLILLGEYTLKTQPHMALMDYIMYVDDEAKLLATKAQISEGEGLGMENNAKRIGTPYKKRRSRVSMETERGHILSYLMREC